MLNPSCKLKSTSIFSNAYFCQYQLTCKCNLKKKGKCNLFTRRAPRSKTRTETPVHSRIKFEFGKLVFDFTPTFLGL